MKVVEESVNYAVVSYTPAEVLNMEDALKLMEDIRLLGYRPLHRLEGKFQFHFVCEKPDPNLAWVSEEQKAAMKRE